MATLTRRVLVALSVLGLASPASAGRPEAGLFAGVLMPGPNHDLYDPAVGVPDALRPGPALGARLGYRPIDLLSVEGEAHGALSAVSGGGGATLYAFRAHAMLLPPLELPAEIEPFLLAGVGDIGISSADDRLGSDLDWAVHLGAGARLPIDGKLGLRLDVRHLLADPNQLTSHPGGHSEVLLGVSFLLGPEGDRDGDGVADNADACVDQQETANGYKDEDGCPDELAAVTVKILDTEGLPAEGIAVVANGKEVGRTGTDGTLLVEGLMPEEHLVLRAEHFHLERTEQAELDLVEGANEGAVTVEWKPGRVRVITRAEGEPMTGASASFTGPKDVPPAFVANGDQTFFLSPGDWRVLVTADTYGTELLELSIGPDERSLVVIEMELEPAKVEVTREEVMILQQILFKSGSAEIEGGSLDLVREVAGTLLAHPYIKRVQIQGHTDSQGPASMNRRLSQARVESVMQWMVDHGVSAEILEARGFGEDEPIADNKTEEGRAKNRRVVFSILEQDLEGEEAAP